MTSGGLTHIVSALLEFWGSNFQKLISDLSLPNKQGQKSLAHSMARDSSIMAWAKLAELAKLVQMFKFLN